MNKAKKKMVTMSTPKVKNEDNYTRKKDSKKPLWGKFVFEDNPFIPKDISYFFDEYKITFTEEEPKPKPKPKRYKFKDHVDIERIFRENAQDGTRAFICIGQKNVIVAIRKNIFSHSNVFCKDTWFENSLFQYKNTFHHYSDRKEFNGYVTKIVTKCEIGEYVKQIYEALEQYDELEKPEYEVIAWGGNEN